MPEKKKKGSGGTNVNTRKMLDALGYSENPPTPTPTPTPEGQPQHPGTKKMRDKYNKKYPRNKDL